jgi:hypothetical protein
MLLGGKGGCQQCTCVPCDACTRTCQNPHTGTAFEPVYTRFFEGVEVGNPTDGYLSASGDNDTSDPYNGMDGTGPWFQRVSGGFSVGGAGDTSTRFPCTYRVSFWRNSYTLGAGTIPPASTALTENVIEVIVSTGALVFPDGRVVTSADGPVALGTVPLVSGGGDASTSDPRSYEGTVSVAPQCMNSETIFTLRATIRWNTQKRQHVLYGIVRECYEEGTPCSSYCSGGSPPVALYLDISNLSVTGESPGQFAYPSVSFIDGMKSFLNGSFVLDRTPNFCDGWVGAADGGECAGIFGPSVSFRAWKAGVTVGVSFGRGNTCRYGAVFVGNIPSSSQVPICNGFYYSGTGTVIYAVMSGDGPDKTFIGSFDWTLST